MLPIFLQGAGTLWGIDLHASDLQLASGYSLVTCLSQPHLTLLGCSLAGPLLLQMEIKPLWISVEHECVVLFYYSLWGKPIRFPCDGAPKKPPSLESVFRIFPECQNVAMGLHSGTQGRFWIGAAWVGSLVCEEDLSSNKTQNQAMQWIRRGGRSRHFPWTARLKSAAPVSTCLFHLRAVYSQRMHAVS